MKKHTKRLILIFSCVLVFFLLSIFLAYKTNFRDPVTVFLKKIYPAVVVGSNYVSINDWELDFLIAKKLDSKSLPQQIFDHLIFVNKKQVLLKKLNIVLESDTIPDEFTFITKNKRWEYEDLLTSYFFNNAGLFEKNVVLPEVVDGQLRIKYNADFMLNSGSYKRVKTVLNRIKSGEKFEDIAKTESDDRISGQLGGDLGFFEHGQILPELEKEITIRSLGQVYDKIVVSRLGYHITYPVETAIEDGKKLWHVKHILIKTEGFENWLNDQIQTYKVWQFIKID